MCFFVIVMHLFQEIKYISLLSIVSKRVKSIGAKVMMLWVQNKDEGGESCVS